MDQLFRCLPTLSYMFSVTCDFVSCVIQLVLAFFYLSNSSYNCRKNRWHEFFILPYQVYVFFIFLQIDLYWVGVRLEVIVMGKV